MQPQHVGRSVINTLCRASQAFAQAANWSVAAAAPASAASYSSSGTPLRWVFLGPPGVGKGTYASRIAAALNVAHIAAGDLVRAEIKSGSTLGQQMQAIVSKGQLLSDEVIIEVGMAADGWEWKMWHSTITKRS